MKRYAIVSKKDDVSRHLAALIKEELKELTYDEEHPEIVISVGGDGTMIYSIHRYEHVLNDVSFVGIHTGTLGFFTDYLKDEYKQLVEDILTKQPEIFDRHLLRISYNGEIFHALNEMRIENSYRSQVIDMYVNDEHMETFRGNGFDVTIEAVGLPSTFQNCIDACCFGGRMVLIGVGKKNLDFNFTLIQKKELNVFGSRNALKKDFLELIDLVNAGKAPLEKIITNVYSFNDAAKAFDDFAHNPGNMLKVVFDFAEIAK